MCYSKFAYCAGIIKIDLTEIHVLINILVILI